MAPTILIYTRAFYLHDSEMGKVIIPYHAERNPLVGRDVLIEYAIASDCLTRE